jgi:two-component system chemotaxis sensor kinase CheA
MDRDKYRRLFIDEATEGLGAISAELLALEKAQNANAHDDNDGHRGRFDAVFRAAHSLKGMAAAMGYGRFTQLAHRLEDLADFGRQGRPLPAEAFDLLLKSVDVLEVCVGRVKAGDDDPDTGELPQQLSAFVDALRGTTGTSTTAPAATSTTNTTTSTTTSTTNTTAPLLPTSAANDADVVVLRVQIARDATAPQVRAFVVHKALSTMAGWLETSPSPDVLRHGDNPEFLARRVLEVRFAAGLVDVDAAVEKASTAQGVAEVQVVRAELKPVDVVAEPKHVEVERTIRVRTALLDDLIDSVGEVLLTRSRLRALSLKIDHPELSDLVDEMDRLTRELHGRVVAARMTPLSFMTERLPRAVRDLARQQGKSVDFTMVGMDIELDRAILDELQAPLVHMVRNAVDHGHEGDDVRAARGASTTMRLTLHAARDRDRVLLTLDDDGRGMDPAALRERAVAKGLLDRARAELLSDDAALELICLPGFSTTEAVTQTSGRGVGMDVVKASLEKLGGVLQLRSTPGRGTSMQLQLPLTVAIIQVLVLDLGDDSAFVLPVARVEAALALEPDTVSEAAGQRFVRVGDALVPLLDLAPLLGLSSVRPPLSSGLAATAVLVRGPDGLVAYLVAAITAQEEVVAKPLGPPLSTLPFVAGAAILADGRAAFILEPQRLSTAGRALQPGR